MRKLICIALLFFSLPLFVGFTAPDDGVPVTVIMYHHITNNPKFVNTYTIMEDSFYSDVDYLVRNGYNCVTIEDLINYVYNGKDLPSNAVMLTFDDGYLSFYKYAYPTLKKLGAKAVLSVIGYWTEEYSSSGYENIVFSHVTWNQMREMQDSGYVEIQNHTYNMHRPQPRRGTLRKKGESEFEYKKNFCADILLAQKLFEKNSGIIPTAFTYPFGYIESTAEGYLQEMGFLSTLSCTSGINHIKRGNSSTLFSLKRYNRTDKKTIKNFV